MAYAIISERRRSSKSRSISGIEIRSGFRKRSNNKPCFIGSSAVIPSAYETKEPAAEPRPGPTRIPTLLACEHKSDTTRKYPGNPILIITSNS